MKKKKPNKKSQNQKLLRLIMVLSLAILAALIVAIVVSRVKDKRDNGEAEPAIDFEPMETGEEETTAVQESGAQPETQSEPEQVEYPMPEYDFTCEEVTVVIPGLEEEYDFAWVSDMHMITDLEAAEDVMAGNEETIQSRYEYFSTPDGIKSADLWPEVVKFLNYGDFDGILFGGDLLDYCSKSNLDTFMGEFEKLNPNVPVLYIRADHDYGYWYGGEALTEYGTHELHREIDRDDINDKYWEFDDFILIGVNNSTKDMPQEQLDLINALYDKGKKIIMVTHVPYASKTDESLEALSMEVRNKVYYWGGGDYVPNAVTGAYLDMVYADSTNICQVLAGHLHAKWDGMLTQEVPQHIFSPAYTGTIGIIHVTGKGEENGQEE